MSQEPGASRVMGLLLPGLKRWRIRRGLTQQQLADRVGARLQYVSRVEQGRGCNRAVAKKMAEALGVDLDELRAEAGGEDPGTRYPCTRRT
jgi:transcriptional regulator with XRE-family HTH domain